MKVSWSSKSCREWKKYQRLSLVTFIPTTWEMQARISVISSTHTLSCAHTVSVQNIKSQATWICPTWKAATITLIVAVSMESRYHWKNQVGIRWILMSTVTRIFLWAYFQGKRTVKAIFKRTSAWSIWTYLSPLELTSNQKKKKVRFNKGQKNKRIHPTIKHIDSHNLMISNWIRNSATHQRS